MMSSVLYIAERRSSVLFSLCIVASYYMLSLSVGICPGPGLYAAAAGVVGALVAWMPSFLVGSHIGINFADYLEKKKLL